MIRLLAAALSRAALGIGTVGSAAALSGFASRSTVGLWFTVFSLVAMAASFSAGGGSNELLRRWTGGAADRADLRHAIMLVARVASFAFVPAIVLIRLLEPAPSSSNDASEGMAAVALLVLLLTIAVSIERLLPNAAKGSGQRVLSFWIGAPISRLLFALAVAAAALRANEGSLLQIGGIYVVVSLVTSAVLGSRITFAEPDGPPVCNIEHKPWRLGRLWRLNLHGLATAALAQADIVIVGLVLGVEAAGVYGVSVRLAVLFSMPLQLASTWSVRELGSALASRNYRNAALALRNPVRAASAAAIVGYLAFAWVGRDVIDRAFGSEYHEAYALVLILGAGQLVNCFVGPVGQTLVLLGADARVLGGTLVGAVVLAALIVLAVGVGDANVVAVASALSVVVQNLYWAIGVRNMTGLTTRDYWLKARV